MELIGITPITKVVLHIGVITICLMEITKGEWYVCVKNNGESIEDIRFITDEDLYSLGRRLR